MTVDLSWESSAYDREQERFNVADDEPAWEDEDLESDIFSESTVKAVRKGELDEQRAADFSVPPELRDVRLASSDVDVELRSEVAAKAGLPKKYIAQTVPECIEEFRRWHIGYEDKFLHFSNGDESEVKPCTNSYTPEYTERQYARMCDLERRLSEEYGARLHTALLSFTCSYTTDAGALKPPVDHLMELLESYDAVTTALDRVMGDRRWARLAILEPHDSGYAHLHFAVFVDGEITESTFKPVIDAHLRNCPGALKSAHNYDSFDPSDRPISVFHSGRRMNDRTTEMENLAAYLAAYIGNYGESPLDTDVRTQFFYTTIWAARRQRIRPCQTAQDYMLLEDDDEDPESDPDWVLVGIQFEVDGEVYEMNEDPGVVETFVPGTLVDADKL